MCVRSDCGCVSGLAVLITTHFGRISSRGDGNFEEMALKQIALSLLALLGSVAVGNGKFELSSSLSPALSRCVFLDRASPVVAQRHGALDQGFG